MVEESPMFSAFDFPINMAWSPMMELRSIMYFISALLPTMLSSMMELDTWAPSDMDTCGPMMQFSMRAFLPMETGSRIIELMAPFSEMFFSDSSIRLTSNKDLGLPQSYQLFTSNVRYDEPFSTES